MPTRTIPLENAWTLTGFDGYGESITTPRLPEALHNAIWIDAQVPGSAYRDLTRAGWIADVYADCNTLAAQWVEQHYWYYRTHFDAPSRQNEDRCHLVLEGLDYDAAIFLNGQPIGTHANLFTPFRLDITENLHPTDNELIIRLDAGLHRTADKSGGDYNLEVTAMLTKRPHLRKPQFTSRWDWSPRLMQVGIVGGARLEVCRNVRLEQAAVYCTLADDHQTAEVRVRALIENLTGQVQPVTLRADLAGESLIAESKDNLPAGLTEVSARLQLPNPKLWWPRSQGAQPLYDLDISLLQDDEVIDARRRRFGVRSAELQQPPAPDGDGRLFHLCINREPIFCKGANWVPADLLYANVTPGDYRALVDLAVELNFNMLRIWGGGLYEHPAFFEACDEAGILVWNDLAFACTRYPGDDEAFCKEVSAEVAHNIRARAHHPSIVLWCGNNEVDLGTHDNWLESYDPARVPCQQLFHQQLARVVKREDPTRPYWPTSPFSPDGSHPNNPLVGDQHPWQVGLGEFKADYWQYRNDASRFPNEGGVLGPSTPKTLAEILPPAERRIGSRTWLHHDNTQNNWRGEPMVDHLLRLNLIDDPRTLAFHDYVHYAGILHGEALETAIDNWRRRKFNSAAAVFWMFNDTWPAVTSWTPIDYARRRKTAFWYVKRACANLRAICVEQADEIVVYVVNDHLTSQRVTLRFGIFALTGQRPLNESLELECPANASVPAARFPASALQNLGRNCHGAFAILENDCGHQSTHRLFLERFRDLQWMPAHVQCTHHGDTLCLESNTFAWSVALDTDGETPLADNHFDLIPGIERRIPWPKNRPTPKPISANMARSRAKGLRD